MGHFTDRLVALRQSKNLSMSAVARRAEMSRSYLNNIEKGDRRAADNALLKLAKALDVPFNVMRAWRDMDEIDPAVLMPRRPTPMTLIDGGGRPVSDMERQLTQTPVWIKSKYPPTEEELEIIRTSEELGILYASFSDPTFWDYPPKERRSSLRYLEGLMDEQRRFNNWKDRA